MNFKYFAVLFFVASAAAVELIDPLGNAREQCRVASQLTKQQLANAKNYIEAIPDYVICLIEALGIPTNERGELDVAVSVAVVEPVTPPSISRPVTECCNAQVVASGARTRRDQAIVFAKCLIATLPPVLFDIAGYLCEPVTPRSVEQCFRSVRTYYN